MQDGFIPSFCTACYRKGRTGAAFMKIAKSGRIQDFCQPNALLSLQEYMEVYVVFVGCAPLISRRNGASVLTSVI